MSSAMLFKDIPAGRCFRLAEAEKICSRMVFDEGVFVKIGNSHAVRIQAGLSEKTIIPGIKAKCVVLPGKIDTSHLPDWHLVNFGRTK